MIQGKKKKKLADRDVRAPSREFEQFAMGDHKDGEIPVDATPASVTFASMNGEPDGKFDLKKGIVGALLGASLGVGFMLGYYMLEGFRFPLLGVGIGILTGYGARLLFKGTDTTLGYISGGIALLAVVATLFLMYGTFPIVSIISVIVSVSFAYKIAAG